MAGGGLMEEEVKNSILCFKHADGRWVPYSKKQLTAKLIRQKQEATALELRLRAVSNLVSDEQLPEMMKRQAL